MIFKGIFNLFLWYYVIQKSNIQMLKSTLQKLKVKSTRRVYECIQDIVKGQFIQIRFRMSFCFIQNTNEHNMQIYFWIELMGYQSCLFVSKIILHPWRTGRVKNALKFKIKWKCQKFLDSPCKCQQHFTHLEIVSW